jgi:hypothetical protein
VLDLSATAPHVIHMKDRRTKRDWRASLTPAERKRIAAVERDLVAAETKLILLRAERNRIQNRATARAGK